MQGTELRIIDLGNSFPANSNPDIAGSSADPDPYTQAHAHKVRDSTAYACPEVVSWVVKIPAQVDTAEIEPGDGPSRGYVGRSPGIVLGTGSLSPITNDAIETKFGVSLRPNSPQPGGSKEPPKAKPKAKEKGPPVQSPLLRVSPVQVDIWGFGVSLFEMTTGLVSASL